MGRQVVVRTKRNYWHDYILQGLSKNLSREQIRNNLLDAFRKEIFDQISMFVEPANLQGADPGVQKRVANIIRQTSNKWKSLCKMCNEYRETFNMIKPSDILEIEIDTSVKNTDINEEL